LLKPADSAANGGGSPFIVFVTFVVDP